MPISASSSLNAGFSTSTGVPGPGSKASAPLPVVTTDDLPQKATGNKISKNRRFLDKLPSALRDTTSASQNNPSIRSQPLSKSHADHQHQHKTKDKDDGDDAGSAVSSLTGAGFDPEIVEELHTALNELRAELEESRAEAARAVKVAEQAIQSAEQSNSKEWNATVTHKAAEAAAMAQKRSAEAMARQRIAEERLDAERKNAAFWRKQAESAEEEAGALQTRAAAAEVQRALMMEELEAERQKSSSLVKSTKGKMSLGIDHQHTALDDALDRNRQLELELEGLRLELATKNNQDLLDSVRGKTRGGSMFGRTKREDEQLLLSTNSLSSERYDAKQSISSSSRDIPQHRSSTAELMRVQTEFTSIRKQFELLKKSASDELSMLPKEAELWAQQASNAVMASQVELQTLRAKLAMESATRRKLLSEVQDLRGAVRVYCRPRPIAQGSKAIVSVSSREVVLLHRELVVKDPACSTPLSFEFDGVFDPESNQRDVYDELEETCLGVLDGYNICVLAFGQSGSGKTLSLLGDVHYMDDSNLSTTVANHGVQLQTMHQLFSVVEHRSERYRDVVRLSIVEVCDERLVDLLVGTECGDERGQLIGEDKFSNARSPKNKSPSRDVDSNLGTSVSSKPTKLEIKTDKDGRTIVAGLLSVQVHSFSEFVSAWQQCLSRRASRCAEAGLDRDGHNASSHVIATLEVVSTNVTTGIGTVGKIHFVDFAGSDVVPKPSSGSTSSSKKTSASEALFAGVGNAQEWKFSNKSMTTLNEVVHARSQYSRTVPYRNSTITHLLSDSLEADSKVVLLACVSSEQKDLQDTACTLRFAQKMRKIIVGKATKHTIGRK